jgi:spermidine synthase
VGQGSRVVVRARGRGRALPVDGTLASYYEPGSAITGSVWDALAAGLLALPLARRRSVLLLGLGGGSAARVVRALAPRARIVAVEIDREVVRLARRFFGLDALGVEVRIADARDALARGRGRFDAVLEDVFVGSGRAVVKPPGFPEPALARAARRLAPGGVLVSNALDEAPAVARAMRGLFPRVVRIGVEDYDNQIFVGGGPDLSARALRAAVSTSAVLAPTLPRLSLRTLAAL